MGDGFNKHREMTVALIEQHRQEDGPMGYEGEAEECPVDGCPKEFKVETSELDDHVLDDHNPENWPPIFLEGE